MAHRCNYTADWMYLSCDLPYVHGDKQPDFTCVSHECMTGRGCNDTCNGYATSDNGICSCDLGWRVKCKTNLTFFHEKIFIYGFCESKPPFPSVIHIVANCRKT